jgi:hypothetical protein
MYNHNMSVRKKSWFGIAKSFVKAIEKEQAKSRTRVKSQVKQTPRQLQPTFAISVTDDDGNEYVSGFQSMNPNPKYKTAIRTKLGFLVNFYKDHALEFDFGDDSNFVDGLIKKMYPSADAHTCPYCGVTHEFTAVRARKCPDCGNQMVVRQGRFLSKEQVERLESAITRYYEKSGLINQLKHAIEQTQYYANDDNYGRAFLEIAQGYQLCAALLNKKYDGGSSAWDYSWQTLNGEAFEIAGLNAANSSSLIGNGYSDVVFARGKHCLQELKFAENDTARNKYAKAAIAEFLSYLSMLDTVGLTDWHQEDAMRNIHIAKTYGKVSSADFDEISQRVFARSSPKPSAEIFQNTLSKVGDYIFLDTDPDRLRQLIY